MSLGENVNQKCWNNIPYCRKEIPFFSEMRSDVEMGFISVKTPFGEFQLEI